MNSSMVVALMKMLGFIVAVLIGLFIAVLLVVSLFTSFKETGSNGRNCSKAGIAAGKCFN
jgi:F0F1-type ATP synthase assembly protein I